MMQTSIQPLFDRSSLSCIYIERADAEQTLSIAATWRVQPADLVVVVGLNPITLHRVRSVAYMRWSLPTLQRLCRESECMCADACPPLLWYIEATCPPHEYGMVPATAVPAVPGGM